MERNRLETFGVELTGVDLSGPLSTAELAELRALIDTHGLVVARRQDVDESSHVNLIADLFPDEPITSEFDNGDLFSYVSNTTPDGYLGEMTLSFHSDLVFTTSPDLIVSLYGSQVGEGAADTEFVNGTRALQTLLPELRERIAGLHVVFACDLQSTNVRFPSFNLPGRQDLSGVPHDACPRARWPAVLEHPRTGEPILFVNEMLAHHFEGVALEASRELLGQLYAHLYADEQIYRHRWRPGDLLIWDNLAVQHGRRGVFPPGVPRRLRRVRLNRATMSTIPQFSQAGVV